MIDPEFKFPPPDKRLEEKQKKNSERKSILFIDEVDVFFSESFYGKTFNPVSVFSSKEIREVIELIYKRGKKVQGKILFTEAQIYQEVQTSAAYLEIKKKYEYWIQILDYHFYLMIISII